MTDHHHTLASWSCYENVVARIPASFHRHVTLIYQLVRKTQLNLSHICTHSLHMISLSPSDIAACITHLLLHKILNMRLSHQFTNYSSESFPPNLFLYFDQGWKFLDQTSMHRLNHFFRLLYLFLRKLVSRKLYI